VAVRGIALPKEARGALSGWTDFAVVMGGACAALLGLLFVAVSLRVDAISRSNELRNRTSQTLALLLVGLLASAMLAIPDQPAWVLGAEYLALAVVLTGVSIVLGRRAGHSSEGAVAQLLHTTNPTLVTCVLLLVAAVVLVLGHDDGVYFVVPALIAVLVGGVVNAWVILIGLTEVGPAT
jgi:hypothetical protein